MLTVAGCTPPLSWRVAVFSVRTVFSALGFLCLLFVGYPLYKLAAMGPAATLEWVEHVSGTAGYSGYALAASLLLFATMGARFLEKRVVRRALIVMVINEALGKIEEIMNARSAPEPEIHRERVRALLEAGLPVVKCRRNCPLVLRTKADVIAKTYLSDALPEMAAVRSLGLQRFRAA